MSRPRQYWKSWLPRKPRSLTSTTPGTSRWTRAERRRRSDIVPPADLGVAPGEDGVAHRPVDGEARVVPGHRELRRPVVVSRLLVGEERLMAEDQVAAAEPRRHQHLQRARV